MASIRKIETPAGGTRWRLRVYVGSDPETGKRTYITQTFRRKKDALKRATKLEGQKDGGELVAPSKETLTAYLRRWLTVKRGHVQPSTWHDYSEQLKCHIFAPPATAPQPLLGTIRLHRLNGEAFEDLYTYLWLERGLSPRSLRYLHTVLRQALKHAVKKGVLARNPTDDVTPPTKAPDGVKPEKKCRPMTREQAGRFLTVASENRYAALWSVLLMGGLRPGEAFGLRWEDVDLEGGKLHVNHALTRRGVQGWLLVEPKTKRGRRAVVLPPVATASLRAHRKRQAAERLLLGTEYQDDGFVFTTTFGSPLDRGNVTKQFQRLLHAAGLERYRLYDLRHTCATLLLLAGENPKVVSERLGHSSVVITLDVYSHVLPSMQEASADKLEAMFGGDAASRVGT